MPKVVKHKKTGITLYRQSPDFEKGKGILNTLRMYPELTAFDIKEVYISDEKFKKDIEKEIQEGTHVERQNLQ